MQDVMHIMPCLHCYINLKAVAQGCAQSGLDGVAACVKLAVFFFFFIESSCPPPQPSYKSLHSSRKCLALYTRHTTEERAYL